MARRAPSSQSRSQPNRLPDMIGDFPLGRHTGLPLMICDVCYQHRIIELVVQSDENGNRGRVFFKCPRNIPGDPGRCTFYEFQREYLGKLVKAKKVVLLPGEGTGLEDEAASTVPVSKPLLAEPPRLDALVHRLTFLCILICLSVVLLFVNLLK